MASSEKNISQQEGLSRSEGSRAFACPKCSKLFKVPFKKKPYGSELYPFKIICEHCKKDVSKQFFQALVSNGCKYKRSRMFGKAEESSNPSTAMEVISADQALTFSQALERLPLKERMFVLEYVKDFHATGAALRSGYSPKSARQIASRLLSKASISIALQCFYRERREASKTTVEDIEKVLDQILFTNITDIISITKDGLTFMKEGDELPDAAKTAIKNVKFNENMNGISIKVTMHDKIAALKLRGMQLGMFIQRKQVHEVREKYEDWRRRVGYDK